MPTIRTVDRTRPAAGAVSAYDEMPEWVGTAFDGFYGSGELSAEEADAISEQFNPSGRDVLEYATEDAVNNVLQFPSGGLLTYDRLRAAANVPFNAAGKGEVVPDIYQSNAPPGTGKARKQVETAGEAASRAIDVVVTKAEETASDPIGANSLLTKLLVGVGIIAAAALALSSFAKGAGQGVVS